jgi:catechol 2,3-dioxygenase-like lactoylglutathione lyase family enzyme
MKDTATWEICTKGHHNSEKGANSMSTTPVLDFTLFYVSDLEESLKFFTQTLGLQHDPQQNSPFFRGFVGSPMGLALPMDEARRPGKVELYFKVDDIEAVHSELASKGAEITEIAQRPFGSIFSVTAPDGHLVTILQELGE